MSRDPRLDRRAFLINGGAAAMTTGLTGCATGSGQSRASGRKRERILARLESMLGGVDAFRFHEDYRGMGPGSGYSMLEVRTHDQQLREHIRSFMIAGAAKELGAPDPEFDRIITPYRDEVDAAVLGSLTRTEALANEDDTAFLELLREQPRLPLEVCEVFDSIAEVVGTPVVSRQRLARAASRLSWRFERQDPATVMAEYAAQANRQLARYGAPAPAEGDAAPAEPAPEPGSIPDEIPPELLPGSQPQPDTPPSTDAPVMEGSTPPPSGPPIPSYTDVPAAPSHELPPPEPRPIGEFQGHWSTVDLLGEPQPRIFYVKRIKNHEVVLFTTGGKRMVEPVTAVRWASAPQWNANERAKVERGRRGFGAMVGIGASLLILGAVLTPLFPEFGLGTIPLTPGVVLLVVGAVYLSRLKHPDR